jgi:hypothetical protein
LATSLAGGLVIAEASPRYAFEHLKDGGVERVELIFQLPGGSGLQLVSCTAPAVRGLISSERG